jgi:hypothetical protein
LKFRRVRRGSLIRRDRPHLRLFLTAGCATIALAAGRNVTTPRLAVSLSSSRPEASYCTGRATIAPRLALTTKSMASRQSLRPFPKLDRRLLLFAAGAILSPRLGCSFIPRTQPVVAHGRSTAVGFCYSRPLSSLLQPAASEYPAVGCQCPRCLARPPRASACRLPAGCYPRSCGWRIPAHNG